MKTIESKYTGELRTEATHVKSGTILTTDAPLDNQGRGEFFSPTDLVATALGSCMVTIMGIAGRIHGYTLEGATWNIIKVMTDNPRRIGEIIIELNIPGIYSDKQKAVIEYITKNCPVALSLHPDLKQTVTVNYPDM